MFPGVARIETGVEQGDTISPFYDPMVAKIVCRGDDRAGAIAALSAACGAVECEPVRTNAWFLKRLLDRAEFRDGDITTGFIAQHLDTLGAAPAPSQALLHDAAIDLILGDPHLDGFAHAFITEQAGFRVNVAPQRTVRLMVDGTPEQVALSDSADPGGAARTILVDGVDLICFEAGAAFRIAAYRTSAAAAGGAGDGTILSPMPGRIIAVSVAAGDTVTKGQKLVTLEAMKMEHTLVAPFDGTIADLPVHDGGQVGEGTLIVRVEAAA